MKLTKKEKEMVVKAVERSSNYTFEALARQVGMGPEMNLSGLDLPLCPFCKGGDKRERSFAVKVTTDSMLFKCFRANKCNRSGWVSLLSYYRRKGQILTPAEAETYRALLTDGVTMGKDGIFTLPDLLPGAFANGSSAKEAEFKPKETLDMTAEVEEYLTETRKIALDVVKRNKIGMQKCWTDHNKIEKDSVIVFPTIVRDEVKGQKMRRLEAKVMWKTPNSVNALFGFDNIVGQKEIIIVEGEVDALSCETAGFTNVASVSSGAGNESWLEFENTREILMQADRIYLATDCDEAGDASARRLAAIFGYKKCFRVTWMDGCKDANEVLVKHGPDGITEGIRNAKTNCSPSGMPDLADKVEEAMSMLTGDMDEECYKGISTGWGNLDTFYRPVRGELTVITGSPGSGKTEWLVSLVLQLARLHEGKRFLLFQFEAMFRTIITQLIEKQTKKRISNKFRSTDSTDVEEPATPEQTSMTDDAHDAVKWLDKRVVVGGANFDADITLEAMLECMKLEAEAKEKGGLWGVVIDPYNYIAMPDKRIFSGSGIGETFFISTMLSQLKAFALEHSCHVWIVAHPTKNTSWVDGAKPSLYDIAGSAHWFNKCDMGLILTRETFKLEDGERVITSTLEVEVAKARNREAGQLGTVRFDYDFETRSYQPNEDPVEKEEPREKKDKKRRN